MAAERSFTQDAAPQIASLVENLQRCLREKQITDVMLVDKDSQHSIDCHKVVLISGCRYFQNILDTEQDYNIIQIDVPDWSAVVEVIKYIYGGRLQFTTSNACNILVLSLQWGLKSLTDSMEAFLQSDLSNTTAAKYHQIAFENDLKNLLSATDLYIRRSFHQVSLADLSAKPLATILRNDALNIQDEDHIFQSVNQWYLEQKDKDDPNISLVLHSLRFCEMSRDFLYTVVNQSEIMRHSPGRDILEMELRNLQSKRLHQRNSTRYWNQEGNMQILAQKITEKEDSFRNQPVVSRFSYSQNYGTSTVIEHFKNDDVSGHKSAVAMKSVLIAINGKDVSYKYMGGTKHGVARFEAIEKQKPYGGHSHWCQTYWTTQGKYLLKADRCKSNAFDIKLIDVDTGDAKSLPNMNGGRILYHFHGTRDYVYGLSEFSLQRCNVTRGGVEWETMADALCRQDHDVLVGDDTHLYLFSYYSRNYSPASGACKKKLQDGCSMQIYDMAKDRWTLGQPPLYNPDCAVIFNKEIVGFSGSHTCVIYNIASQRWRYHVHSTAIFNPSYLKNEVVIYNGAIHRVCRTEHDVYHGYGNSRLIEYRGTLCKYDINTHQFTKTDIQCQYLQREHFQGWQLYECFNPEKEPAQKLLCVEL